MSIQDQWEQFRAAIDESYPDCERREAIGASNAPFVLDNGFRFGLFNIDSVDCTILRTEGRAFAMLTRLVLPPRTVLHLALIFEGDELDKLGARKAEIAATDPANKVRVYLHESGIFLRQDRDVPNIDPADPAIGQPISATAGCFLDVERQSRLDPVEVAYVNYLAALLEPIPLQRLGHAGDVKGDAALNLAELDFAELRSRIESLGARYEPTLVERYHIALNHLSHKHFVLLTGISGTGKTMLSQAYAYAAFGIPSLDLDAKGFYLISVRPEWTEPSYLLGYEDALSGRYQKTPFLDAMIEANGSPHRPVFVCLDEMNLAQPEHYFADVLSAMESGQAIRLHGGDETQLGVPGKIDWPHNLYIVGTVNVDETTRPFSPKVLDRANVIDMSAVDLAGFLETLKSTESGLSQVLDERCCKVLTELAAALQPHNLHFGYRVIREIAFYLSMASNKGLLAGTALDLQIEQKILTKLRGGPELAGVFDGLRSVLAQFPTSLATVERLSRDLDRYGSFQYWT